MDFSENNIDLDAVVGTRAATAPASVSEDEFKPLLAYLERIKFGTVTLRIQSSKIIGVDKSEKIKL
jgi:hypothetical protein